LREDESTLEETDPGCKPSSRSHQRDHAKARADVENSHVTHPRQGRFCSETTQREQYGETQLCHRRGLRLVGSLVARTHTKLYGCAVNTCAPASQTDAARVRFRAICLCSAKQRFTLIAGSVKLVQSRNFVAATSNITPTDMSPRSSQAIATPDGEIEKRKTQDGRTG
jgi:hypothetical protein